jgi:hypothetical protein
MKSFGKEIYRAYKLAERAKDRYYTLQKRIKKIVEAKMKSEKDAVTYQKKCDDLAQRREEYEQQLFEKAERKRAEEEALAQKRERLTREAQERRERVEKARASALKAKRAITREMKEEYARNEETIRTETEHDLKVVRDNRLRIDTDARNNHRFTLMQSEKLKSERTEEIKQTIAECYKTRSEFSTKYKELKS